MKERKLELDLYRARARFPGQLMGVVHPWHPGRQYLTGRMRADRVQVFVESYRRILEERYDTGEARDQIRKLTKRRTALMRQLHAPLFPAR